MDYRGNFGAATSFPVCRIQNNVTPLIQTQNHLLCGTAGLTHLASFTFHYIVLTKKYCSHMPGNKQDHSNH